MYSDTGRTVLPGPVHPSPGSRTARALGGTPTSLVPQHFQQLELPDSRYPATLPMLGETAPPERDRTSMTNETSEPPARREGECPYCERTVLAYEEPPRCPLCACPLDMRTTRPYVFPDAAVTDPD